MASRHMGARAAKYADLDTRTSAVMEARALRQAAEEEPQRRVQRALLPVTVGLEFNSSGPDTGYMPLLLPPAPTLTHPPHCSTLDGRVQALLARDAQVVKSVVKQASFNSALIEQQRASIDGRVQALLERDAQMYSTLYVT
jgi:hypothetical protein